jgi:hypothetical protein
MATPHWENLFAAFAADFPVKSHLGFLPRLSRSLHIFFIDPLLILCVEE